MHVKHLLVLLFIPTKYESKLLKNKVNIYLLKKVNQKVNFGRHPMPAHPNIAILKDGFKNLFEKVEMLHSAMSYLDLHCLPITLLEVSKLKWVNKQHTKAHLQEDFHVMALHMYPTLNP